MKRILTLAIALIGLLVSKGTFATIYPSAACMGSTPTLTDSSSSGVSTGGTWSSSNVTIATIGMTSGILTPVSPGVCTITYTGTSVVTTSFTVSAAPAAITGSTGPICVGATTTLSDATPGGTWYSYSTYVATVGSATGVVTGVHGGTATIVYSTGGTCSASIVVTVTGTASDSVSGASTVCVGSTGTLTSTISGGTWSSSSTSIATVSSSGVVTGITSGTVTITHTTSGTCGSVIGTRVVTVTSTTSPGTITGTTTVAIGSTTSLYDAVTGGTWTSGSTSIATISSSGVVTGVAAGTSVITYTVSGCSGPASAYTTVTVTTPNCISGNVLFTGAAYYGSVKVWLIKYNPTTHILSAVDSTYAYSSSGTSAHYSFCGMGTDSFRVKAADDSMTTGTGYLPTYHTSSPYWGTATVIYHVSGTNDINKDITMGYGTTTTGPGFIGGDVTTGANKGTSGIPAVGLLIYCVDNSTGSIYQRTLTDASGHYSFSNLPTGVPIKIYPEAINYATTPYPVITLTTGSTSVTAASFVQHTISMTITPNTTGVSTVAEVNAGISVYPNPASGTLNVKWNAANAGNATVSIADVTGRQVLKTNVDMSQASGTAPVSLNGISAGIYMINIKANGVNYNAKIEVK